MINKKNIIAISIFILIVIGILISQPILSKLAQSAINKNWPPVSFQERQIESIKISSKSLSKITDPSFLVTLDQNEVEVYLQKELQRLQAENKFSFTLENKPTIIFDNQSINIDTIINGSIKDKNVSFKGHLQGLISLYIRETDVILSPAFESIEMEIINVSKLILNPSKIAESINLLLKQYIDNINGQIEPIKYKIPIKPLGTPDQPGESINIQIGSGDDEKELALPPVILTATAILVDRFGLHIMGQLDTEVVSSPEGDRVVNEDFNVYSDSFYEKGIIAFKEERESLQKTGIKISGSFLNRLLYPVIPKVSYEQRRLQAIKQSIEEFNELKGPDFSVFLSQDKIREELDKEINIRVQDLNQKGLAKVGKVNIVLGNQEILAEAPVSGIVSQINLGFQGIVKAASAFSTQSTEENLGVLISPSIQEFVINEITYQPEDITSVFIPTLPSTLNAVLSEITNNFNSLIEPIVLSTEQPKIGDKNGEIDFAKATEDLEGLEFSNPKFKFSKLYSDANSILISESGIFLQADLNAPNLPERPSLPPLSIPEDTESATKAYKRYSQRFMELHNTTFGSIEDDVIAQAAMSVQRFSSYFNSIWKINSPQIKYLVDYGPESFSDKKISLIEKPSYSCNPTRDCSRKSCTRNPCKKENSCSRKSCEISSGKCDFDCRSCRTIKVGGYRRRTCVPDIACEARKLRCNANEETKVGECKARENLKYGECEARENLKYGECEARENLKYGECETREKLKLLDCNRLKEQERLACNAGRELQNGLSSIGDIGKIGGKAKANGIITSDLSSLELSEDAKNIKFRPNLSGNIDVSGQMKFTPFDIGNILVCPVKGAANFSTKVSLPTQTPSISANLKLATEEQKDDDENTLDLAINISEFTLNAKLNPPPATALLQENPHMLVLCNPVLGVPAVGLSILGEAKALKGDDLIRALGGNKLSGLFAGDYKYKLDEISIPTVIPPIDFEISDDSFLAIPSWTEKGIVYTVKRR
ncbi:hypothetical protein [Moorena sp. SIO3I8]|uniref:hypothetical protein n=1 Tax=Moorena sp. SIO3I8 TaxID=2607833 RepID=UPI0013BFCEBF|nr:hypothetical protein [Moorena sp. SIO3I8]NEO05778.1 hypothetical protein [Moorena sp. SIO3I8]